MKDFNEMQCYKACDEQITKESEYCESSWSAINELIFEHFKENDFKLSAGPYMVTGYDLPIEEARVYCGRDKNGESLVDYMFFYITQNQIDKITSAYNAFKRAMDEFRSEIILSDDLSEGKNQ